MTFRRHAPALFLPREAGEGDRAIARWRGQAPTMRAPSRTIAAARRLPRNLSAPEAMLWSRLRTRAPGSPTFRRQHPIGPYVLDFFCATARLAVEIDGMAHDVGDRPQRDQRRDAWLLDQGVTVMRIAAAEVLAAPDDVADGIVRTAIARIEARASRPLRQFRHRPDQ
jgi:very-short-patch-repair endonuclease